MNLILKFGYVFWVLFLVISTGIRLDGEEDVHIIKNWRYLGDMPHGDKPVIFAKNIISKSDSNEYGIHFSKDLKRIFFTRSTKKNPYNIILKEYRDGIWKPAVSLPFIKAFPGVESCLSFDEKRFVYEWIYNKQGEIKQNFYEVITDGNRWSVPKPLSKINFGERTVSPCLAKNRNLYYSGDFDEKGQKDIYVSRYIDGMYTTPKNLGKNVNSKFGEAHVFVDPEERFILFDSDKPNKFGRSDIFISFKDQTGTWTKAENLGENVNSKEWDWYPYISPDGKYLFFCRTINRNIDLYWIETRKIEIFRKLEKNK